MEERRAVNTASAETQGASNQAAEEADTDQQLCRWKVWVVQVWASEVYNEFLPQVVFLGVQLDSQIGHCNAKAHEDDLDNPVIGTTNFCANDRGSVHTSHCQIHVDLKNNHYGYDALFLPLQMTLLRFGYFAYSSQFTV